ncbi:MAG: DUF3137 domain-containing protein [Allosphingosinicella sp.]|uniref:DUF3137 domain-containing protein n=1 Tax=Allosphingosinicella sp. TaxID=2823234 RepID=UPI003945A144
MIELTAGHFEALCRKEPVRAEIGALTDKRKAALRSFWTRLIAGIALSVGAFYALGPEWGAVVGIIGFVAAIVVASLPLTRAKEELKHPVLEALAADCGLHYMPTGFDPPVMADAVQPLFGSFSSSEFTDLFWGEDGDARRFALYEAKLERRQGKNSHTIFRGQVFAFQRRAGGRGTTIVRPDWGLFNFFKPAKGMERVQIDTDAAFEKKFAAYGTDPLATRQILFDADLRRLLMELRKTGRVFLYASETDVLVAVQGGDLFEPGSMFKGRSGEERVRAMFDDVRGALGTLKALRGRLG